MPGFRATFSRYVERMQKLSQELLSLAGEALQLPPNAFSRFVEPGGNQDRVKIVKYPVPVEGSSDQGVGPHYDGGFLTLVSTMNVMTTWVLNSAHGRYLALASITTQGAASSERFWRMDRRSTDSRYFRCQHRQRYG